MKRLLVAISCLVLSSSALAQAFAPMDGATVTISVSSSSQRVALAKDGPVRIFNNGTATVWIRCGNSSVVATTSDIPIPAGAIEVDTFNMPTTTGLNCAAIAAGSTGNVYFTPGIGI